MVETVTWKIEGGNERLIDIERLKKDLKNELYGAAFGGGFSAALVESFDVERASPEELVRMAKQYGLRLEKYVVE